MNEKNSTATATNGTKSSTTANSAGSKNLFAAYDKADAEVARLEDELVKARQARSACVAAICDAAKSKGPFRHPTTKLVLSAVERTNKDTGEKNWFFKGPAARDVIESF